MATTALSAPRLMLLDWHGTLVNTYDGIYRSVEEVLLNLEELDLLRRMVPEAQARSREDEKLLRYVRIFRHLHPRILAERRVSRTDIFDALFGDNEEAKAVAHSAYNEAYRRHFTEVTPFQDGIEGYLTHLKTLGIRLGVVTNRSREFFEAELAAVQSGRWSGLFDTTLCGDEARRYKPAPDSLWQAAEALGETPDGGVWYVGDSVTDMVTARCAGITSVFYNGALWESDWFDEIFAEPDRRRHRPDAVVDDFDQLLDLVDASRQQAGAAAPALRPPRLPPRELPPPRKEPDWHPALASLTAPRVILFDWHATLVDTLDAMYHAVDDMLRELREMGLLDQLVPASACKSPEDVRLVEYVREHLCLHPKIKLDRKISRTDIFEVLFGDNEEAKQIAHRGFTRHYRSYYGTVLPFEPKVKDVLQGLRDLDLRLGVITNRDREFLEDELAKVDGTGWAGLFETRVCGDDTARRKPHPDQVYKAVEGLGCEASPSVWYVGDSTTDVIASKAAGITSVFFNGAQWDQVWLGKIFPGTPRYPDKPDVVVNNFSEFWALVLACRRRARD